MNPRALLKSSGSKNKSSTPAPPIIEESLPPSTTFQDATPLTRNPLRVFESEALANIDDSEGEWDTEDDVNPEPTSASSSVYTAPLDSEAELEFSADDSLDALEPAEEQVYRNPPLIAEPTTTVEIAPVQEEIVVTPEPVVTPIAKLSDRLKPLEAAMEPGISASNIEVLSDNVENYIITILDDTKFTNVSLLSFGQVARVYRPQRLKEECIGVHRFVGIPLERLDIHKLYYYINEWFEKHPEEDYFLMKLVQSFVYFGMEYRYLVATEEQLRDYAAIFNREVSINDTTLEEQNLVAKIMRR